MAIRIAIIDGTGAFSEKKYAQGMINSFCSQIARHFGLDPQKITDGKLATQNNVARYERGPSIDGLTTREKGVAAANFLAGGGGDRLVIVGYSRGGSSAIVAAEELANRRPQLKIHTMLLFDPVARFAGPGGEVIPANVQSVWKVKRQFDQKLLEKYDNLVARVTNPVLDGVSGEVLSITMPKTAMALKAANYIATKWSHPMRPDFGFTGEQYMGSGEFKSDAYEGSHGAVGGVGWETVTEDSMCQSKVAAFMNPGLEHAGLPALLKSVGPSQKWEYTLSDLNPF